MEAPPKAAPRIAIAVVVGLGAWLGLAGGAAGGEAEEPGRDAFVTQKCNLCHGVETRGIAAKAKSEKVLSTDLSAVADRRDREWLAQFLLREVELEGKPHKKEFKGDDEELQTLLDWLGTLTASEAEGGDGSP